MPWPRAITAAVEPRIGQRRLWPRCSLLRSVPRDHDRSEEHTSELQSQSNLVCRLLLEKKKKKQLYTSTRPKRLLPVDPGLVVMKINLSRNVLSMRNSTDSLEMHMGTTLGMALHHHGVE